MHPAARPVLALAALALIAGGCSTEGRDAVPTPGTASSPPPAIRTLTPVPLPPDPPPTGQLRAQIRQSSLDAAEQRLQVWLDNDTRRDLTPTRLVFRDPRLPSPVPGQSLRAQPAQVEQGYPVALPDDPLCSSTTRRPAPTLEVHHAGRTQRVRVSDPTDVVGRFVAGRCDALRVSAVADLSWADDVAPSQTDSQTGSGTAPGSIGTLTLVVRPRGDPGHSLRIRTVSGTPLLGSAGGQPVWAPDVLVVDDDGPQRIDLPIQPARCDTHAFMEGGGSTAFAIAFTLDGRRGTVLLRMSSRGADRAVTFARDSCGLS